MSHSTSESRLGSWLQWSDAEAEDNITGAGASSWPWYCELERREDGAYLVAMDDPTGKLDAASRVFTADEFVQVAEDIVAGKYEVSSDVRRYIRQDDIDADACDVILQILLFGEVVYG